MKPKERVLLEITIKEANSNRSYVFIASMDERGAIKCYVLSAILGMVELDSIDHLCRTIKRVIEGLDKPEAIVNRI